MKIKEVRLSEPSPTIQYCFKEYYEAIRGQYYSLYSITLPSSDAMSFSGKTIWRVFSQPFQIWVVWEDGSIWDYSFDRGFMTDLASVPSTLRSIVDNDMPAIILAAIIHDGYYQTKGAFDCVSSGQAKREADDMLREVCLYYGMPKAYSWAIHEAVEKGGHDAWNTFQERDEKRRFRIKKYPSNKVG